MKVVLLHDWLTGFRGGERVLEVLCQMFPDAPLYTLIYKPGSTTKVIEDRKIVSSFLNKIPSIEKHYRKFLPLFPKAAESLKISEDADLVISSSHCVIKGVKKPSGAKHISYIHSPMRYIYDQFDAYFGKNAPLYQQWGARAFRNYLTEWDLQSNQNVDLMIANSQFVKDRITKFYNSDSEIIHPFVDLVDFRKTQKSLINKEHFYLMVTAFAPNKRVDLAIDAFNYLGLPLKIIGGGQQERRLKEKAKSNIEFLGQLGREAVLDNFAKAKAFIFPGVEDFGITPLESLASGTPVIAFKKGGVLETLNRDVASFFEEDRQESLIHAVQKFQEKRFDKETLFKRAEEFSKENFISKIETVIERVL